MREASKPCVIDVPVFTERAREVQSLLLYAITLLCIPLALPGLARAGQPWQIQTVDSPGEVGAWTSLALDSSGHPHITCCDGYPNYDLKYAAWNGSSWAIETVDSNGAVGGYTSLALDSSARPHISYCDWTNVDLKYAYVPEPASAVLLLTGALGLLRARRRPL